MNMPKSRDIQAQIPLPQAIWNEIFGYVTMNGMNSHVVAYEQQHFIFYSFFTQEETYHDV